MHNTESHTGHFAKGEVVKGEHTGHFAKGEVVKGEILA